MKTCHIILTGILAIAAPLPAQDEVLPNELPAAVRRSLDQQAKGGPVKKITREVVDGRTTYLVEIERDKAINPRLRFAETGELLAERADTSGLALDPAAPAPVTYGRVPSLESLPSAVQQTVRNEARGREIGDIDRENWEGRTVYEVEFRSEGRNPQIHIAEDGSLIRGEEPRRGVQDFFRGTQLADLPPAAQETVRREAAGRSLNDIDVERRTGRLVYEVEIRDPQAGMFEIHVDRDGKILRDSRVNVSKSRP